MGKCQFCCSALFVSHLQDLTYSDSEGTPVSSPVLKDAPSASFATSPMQESVGRKRSSSESHADEKRAEMAMEDARSVASSSMVRCDVPRRQM